MKNFTELQAYAIGAAIAFIFIYGLPAVVKIADDNALMGVYTGGAFIGLAFVSYITRDDKRIGKFQALLGAAILVGSLVYNFM